jgi:hypothetical protein
MDPPAPDLADAIVRSFGTAISKCEMTTEWFDIKFHGFPWCPSGKEVVTSRIMVLRLLETLESFGFTLYTTLDVDRGQEGRSMMIFRKQKNWMPVWHR